MENQRLREPVAVARPTPGVSALETDDLDRMSQAFLRWDHQFLQLSRGPFRGRIVFAELGGVQLFDLEVNQALQIRGEHAPDSFVFSPVLPSNSGALWLGRSLKPGMINISGPHLDVNHRTSRDYRHTACSVPRELLERVGVGLIGADFGRLFEVRAPEIDPAHAEALVDRWRANLNALSSPGRMRAECHGGGIQPHGLVAELVRVLAAGRVADPVRLTSRHRARIVREAVDYAESFPPGRVSTLDLCELTGVSERSLQYAFREVTGLSPKDYLKVLRLNQVRRELRAPGRDWGQIGAIACKYGFDRPGRFSADYRRQFGELPSALVKCR
ncbi:transcriptional regulator EutR [Aquisphaera giovannonii]|uniref:Transcriptional regulator EutR n=1 Tax=Aquisphaera giovannonii TaxID=406548 RepID=A0A5B9W4E8_9BACT|nr:helix-turn-helix domain-containing protein [Aquisphaera giovannonii]QEH35493.1 transcriptional regulator EutR [Aquisphaera giovannonii]